MEPFISEFIKIKENAFFQSFILLFKDGWQPAQKKFSDFKIMNSDCHPYV